MFFAGHFAFSVISANKLLVMDIRFEATKRRRKKFEPRVRVWKLKEEKTCEEFRCMVGDKVQQQQRPFNGL